jgi:ankyrin repeat protein
VKADPKLLQQLVVARDEEENTMLHWAAVGGKAEVVEYLVENGLYSLYWKETTNFRL